MICHISHDMTAFDMIHHLLLDTLSSLGFQSFLRSQIFFLFHLLLLLSMLCWFSLSLWVLTFGRFPGFLSPLPISTLSMMSSKLTALSSSICRSLPRTHFQTSLLNSRFIRAIAFLTSPPGCLIDISISTFSNLTLNSYPQPSAHSLPRLR